jgi:hypothetical protein
LTGFSGFCELSRILKKPENPVFFSSNWSELNVISSQIVNLCVAGPARRGGAGGGRNE